MPVTALVLVAVALATAILAASHDDGRAQGVTPSNDNFDRSKPIELGMSPPFGGYDDVASTAGATLEQDEPTCVPDGGATVWYIYHPQVSANLVVDTIGSDFSAFVSVYRITDMVPSPPGGSLEEITCTGGLGAQGRLEFTARTGQGGYAIQVGGVGGETGTLRLRVSCESGCPPPNDEIGTAPLLYQLPFLENGVNTTEAGTEGGEPQPCGNIGKTVWYRFNTYEEVDTVSLIAVATEFSPVIAVYEVDYAISPSPPGAFGELGCSVGAAGEYLTLTFNTEPFTNYYVQFGGEDGAGGILNVLLSCQRDPNQSPCNFGLIEPIETGDGGQGLPGTGGDTAPDTGGSIIGPVTGSGGYLPSR
jgi:hypothetical protein